MHRLMAAFASGLLPAGELAHAHVEHGSNCPALKGKECECRPSVTVTSGNYVVTVAPDGTPRLQMKQ